MSRDDPEIDAVLAEPDAVLFRRPEEVLERVEPHVVPLFFFSGPAELENLAGVGSGVPIRLCGRTFVLSAGHCINDLATHRLAIGVVDHRHRYTPDASLFGYVCSSTADYGFLEINAVDASVWAYANARFLADRWLDVMSATDLEAANDWMVVSGYPGERQTPDEDGALGVTQVTYGTVLCGTADAPESPLAAGDIDTHSVDVSLAEAQNIDANLARVPLAGIPDFGGVSGGACWRAGVRPDPDAWDPDRMRLVGIHIGSSPRDRPLRDDSHRACRQVLVGHHLALIARDRPELRADILRMWPQLAGWAPLQAP